MYMIATVKIGKQLIFCILFIHMIQIKLFTKYTGIVKLSNITVTNTKLMTALLESADLIIVLTAIEVVSLSGLKCSMYHQIIQANICQSDIVVVHISVGNCKPL